MENIINFILNNIYLIWISYAILIAFIDFKDKEISIVHLIIFALISIIYLINIPDIHIFSAVSNALLPIIIFLYGKCTKSMIIGGADYIFFPFFLAPFEIVKSTLIFVLSIIAMSILSSRLKDEIPFITVVVITYILYTVLECIILYAIL